MTDPHAPTVLSLNYITDQCSDEVVCCQSGPQVCEVKDISPGPGSRCNIDYLFLLSRSGLVNIGTVCPKVL